MSKRICILSMQNFKHMTLISLYTSFFEKHNIDYDVIYIDKYDEIEETKAKNVYRYRLKIDKDWSKTRKILAYWSYKKYAIKILDKNKYDFIIIWRCEIALMFSSYLIKNLKNKYCINFRDYCMENNPIIRRIVKKLISFSCFNTISSEGFRSFLPKHEYIFIHSFNKTLFPDNYYVNNLVKTKSPIHICFIGNVRFLDCNKELMNTLKK
jgi:hypothetical protein